MKVFGFCSLILGFETNDFLLPGLEPNSLSEHVILSEGGIKIVDLQVKRPDVADFLGTIPPDELEPTIVRAIEVGVFCLERVRMSQDTEFVRRQVESLLSRVETAVAAIPDATQKAVLEKIDTKDGQVLSPVKAMVVRHPKSLPRRSGKFESSSKRKSIRTKRALLWEKR